MPPSARYPIMLWNPAIAMTVAGSVGHPNDQTLQNPRNEPMLVRELRFTSSAPDGSMNLGGLMIEAKLGDLPLTKDYVPIATVGPSINNGQWYESFRWIFTKPLFLAPGQFLNIKFKAGQTTGNDGLTGGRTITGRVGLFGHSFTALDPSEWPRKLYVPFMSSWTAPDYTFSQNEGGATYPDATADSSEANLINALDVNLYLDRFVGMITTRASSEDEWNPVGGTSTALRLDAAAYLYSLLQMTDSLQNATIRDLTPFPHVFSANDACWPVGAWIPPRAYFIAHLEQQFSNLPTTGHPADAILRTMISMSGYREVNPTW